MTIFKKNLDFLKNNTPLLYKTILEEEPLESIYLEKIEGQDNYIIESKEAKSYMQSAYNVDNEIKSMLKNTESDVDTIILFGIGNGDALQHIIKNYNNLYEIIVVEPSLQIFKTYLENHNINEILKKDLNVTFVVNKPEEFVVDAIYLNMLDSKKTSMVFHISYCSVFNSYYNKMVIELGKTLKVKSGDIRIFAGLSQLWLMNSIKNLKIDDVYPIEKSILDNFKEKTAIIVSAGPSLNKNIHMIEKLKEKAIIFAVGSAIKVLDSKGITPHFRVAIDGLPHENTIFEDIDTSSVPLMFANPLYHEILPKYKGTKIRFILESEYIGKYIYRKSKIPFQEFLSGASVANGLLNLLCGIGCNRIIFMGQDLSYTKEGLHAKGITTEKEDEQWLKTQKYIIVKNVYGEDVYSIDPYLQMKYTMEATIERYKNIEFLNATEGGLGIEGAENLTAEEVLYKKLNNEEVISLEEIYCKLKDNNIKKGYKEKIEQGLDIMKKELLEVREIQEEMLKFIKKLMKLKEKNINLNRVENELIYLETLENKIKEIPAYKEVIANALQSDLLSIKTSFGYKGSERSKIIESKEKIMVSSLIKVREYIDLAHKLIEDDYNEIILKGK